MTSAHKQYNELLRLFHNATKKIIIRKTDSTRKVPTEADEIFRYTSDLINAYNDFAQFVNAVFESQKPDTKQSLVYDFTNVHKPNVLKALAVLSLTVPIPSEFSKIEIANVVPLIRSSTQDDQAAGGSSSSATEGYSKESDKSSETEEAVTAGESGQAEQIEQSEEEEEEFSDSAQNVSTISENLVDISQDQSNPSLLSPNQSYSNLDNQDIQEQEQQVNVTMVQTEDQFLKMAGHALNYKYNGDPLNFND